MKISFFKFSISSTLAIMSSSQSSKVIQKREQCLVKSLNKYENNIDQCFPESYLFLPSNNENVINDSKKGSASNRATVKYQTGGIDKGTFLDGRLHGNECIRIYPDGRKEEGMFLDNVFVEGTLTYPDGRISDGEFEKGNVIKGIKKFPNGGIDRGDFINGKLDGNHCERLFPDGTKEEGVFKYNEFISGIRTYPDGGLDMGYFKDGQLQGWNNSRIYSNGTVVSGRFENHDFKEGLWKESVDSNIARKIVPCPNEQVSVGTPTKDSNINELVLYLFCGVMTFIHFRFSYSLNRQFL